MSEYVHLGLVRIGACDLAIPAHLIGEIVRGPIELAGFPRAPAHVLGAFTLRGEPVPTVDLAAIVQSETAEARPRPVAYAVVIVHPAGRFAIQVDEVLGVVRAESRQITRLEARAGDGLFAEIYTPDSGRPAVVLELETVLEIGGLHSAVSAVRDRVDLAMAPRSPVLPHVVVQAGGVMFSFPAAAVRNVQKRPAQIDSALEHPVLLGFHAFDGRNLAVADLCAMLDLPPGDRLPSAQHLVLLECGGAAVALCVDDIVAIEEVERTAVQALPPGTIAHPEFYAGSFAGRAGGVIMAMAAEALLDALALGDGARLDSAAKSTTAGSRAEDGVLTQFLVYRTGGYTLASALADLETVMEIPAGFVDLRAPGRPLAGLCARMGSTVKLVDLAVLLGSTPTPLRVGSVALCVRTPEGLQGFLVDQVCVLQAAVPRRLPGRDRREQSAVPPFTQLIRARGDGLDRAASIIDLVTVARTLHSELVAGAV
jgi:chemotaxis signal transduction protein